jgi:hypothetical protein
VVWKTVGLNDTKRSFNHDFNGRLKRGIGRGGLWDGDEGRLGRLCCITIMVGVSYRRRRHQDARCKPEVSYFEK